MITLDVRAAGQPMGILSSEFANLLPEGQALDDAAAAFKLSNANTFGLLAALGGETAGALEIASRRGAQTDSRADLRRGVSKSDLLVGMTENERVCMALAEVVGLPAALKYERPFGSGRDVKDIRDGASLPALFALIDRHATTPARDRLILVRWTIFQALIGNADAHAKNLSFFFDTDGLRLAPAYDLISSLVYEGVDHTLAMAIGDEFDPRVLAPYDWASFAAREHLPRVIRQVREEGGSAETLSRVAGVVESQAQALEAAAGAVERIVREEAAASRTKKGAPPGDGAPSPIVPDQFKS
jgi:hypothetical protein